MGALMRNVKRLPDIADSKALRLQFSCRRALFAYTAEPASHVGSPNSAVILSVPLRSRTVQRTCSKA
jgi:hypothetical protein